MDHTSLNSKERYFRGIADNSSEGIIVVHDKRIVFINALLTDFLEFDKDELICSSLNNIMSKEGISKLNEKLKDEDRISPYEESLLNKYGDLIQVKLHASVQIRSGYRVEKIYINGISKSIKQSSDSKNDVIVINQIHGSVLFTDLKGKIINSNNEAKKIFGLGNLVSNQKHISIIYCKDGSQYWENALKKVKNTGHHQSELYLMNKDKILFLAHVALYIKFNFEGKIAGIMCNIVDITKSKGIDNIDDIDDIDKFKLKSQVDQQTREISHTLKKSEIASQQKSNFISRMSHELRTPMNAILGFSQLLEMGHLEVEQRNYVNEILNAGKHLQVMIDEVLDLSKIESGNIELKIESVSVDKVIGECISMVISKATESKVTIINNIADQSSDQVVADYTRLKMVFVNILTNAIKYNVEGGTVTISKKSKNNVTIVEITDSGIGIVENNSNIFDAFNRMGAEYSEIEGSGLGLSIVKNLIELMDGAIRYESTPGEGTVFYIELLKTNFKSNSKEDNQIKLESTQFLKPIKIVCVEDNPANLRLIESILGSKNNIDLHCIDNAEEGIALIRKEKPELILLDINLPGMDGFQALRLLQDDDELKNIPVFALSASATSSDIERGIEAGFTRYLTKPINIKEFLEAINIEIRLIDFSVESK